MRSACIIGLFCGLWATGCSGISKNRNDGHFSRAVECVTPTDPQCMGATTIGGECEMVIEGRKGLQTCEGLHLTLRSLTPENEERTAQISGSQVLFQGLNGRNYKFNAQSDKYDLETDQKDALTPGQTIKIRVRAKPRP